jgi:glyoxylase-like metal-dependent hydrolase (beta-lactamase superfamily II)
VHDGDIIEVGKVKLTVLHTPGHTPGGICLYAAPHLFTGDTLFVGGVGRTDFPGGDTATLMKSIRQKILTLPGTTKVWPGHGYGGNSSTIGREAKSNPYLTGDF